MQPDNPQISCCGETDAFEADTFEVEGDHYVAVIIDARACWRAARAYRCPTEFCRIPATFYP
jgi:hypothetical protein